MPTVLRSGPYRFYFYSHEPNEPPRIHVDREDLSAKFWLDPSQLARNFGFRGRRLWHPLARPGRGPEQGRTAARRARPESVRSCEVDPLRLFSSFRWLPRVTFFPPQA